MESVFDPDIRQLRKATPWIKRVVRYWNADAAHRTGVYTNRITGFGVGPRAVVPFNAIENRVPTALVGRATGNLESDSDWAQFLRPVLDGSGDNSLRNFPDFLELVGAPDALVSVYRRLVTPLANFHLSENPNNLVGLGGLPDYLAEMREAGRLKIIRQRFQPNYFALSRSAGDVEARLETIFRPVFFRELFLGTDELFAEVGELQARFVQYFENPQGGQVFDVRITRCRFRKDCCFC
jgi:hypothetical protein